MRKLVRGVGINDADYTIKINELVGYTPEGKKIMRTKWACPFYSRWANMLMRCYSKSYQNLYPTYIGCEVVESWKTFSNFKRWMELQDWENNHLDKDILFPGNKIYSQDFCVFISPLINTFLTSSEKLRGSYPIGVSLENSTYLAQCSQLNGESIRLGKFKTPEEAHLAWRKEKYRLALILASTQNDQRVSDALIEKYRI